MGDWHQDIVVKNVEDAELEYLAEKIFQYLISEEIIDNEKSDNVLGSDLGYAPGKNWGSIVESPDENSFLELKTNGLDIRKGRNIFWASGEEFEKIECPKCLGNNVNCDWSDLFDNWLEGTSSADLECITCKKHSSISEYKFEPIWALSNLGFTFWNWPIFKNSFLTELNELTGKDILKVEGKL